MNEMTVIYGIVGQPAGSIIGDDVFDADGNHVAFLEDGVLFSAADGQWFGSYVNGVVYNAYGDAEGFREGAAPGLPLMAPRLGTLPPKLRPIGASVRSRNRRTLPEFFARAQGNRRAQVFA